MFQQTENVNIEPEEILKRIEFFQDITVMKDADFIVENAIENISVKKQIYEQLDEFCKTDIIFAANTSCISITQLGSYTKRPEKVIGIHFMNPVSQINAAEVIRGFLTSEETTKKLLNCLKKSARKALSSMIRRDLSLTGFHT